jgi:type I restriction enzyme, S subunit
MNRKNIKLSDVIKIHHGWPFKSEFFREDQNSNLIVVNIGNFRYEGGFRFESTRVRGYSGPYPKEYELKPSDILLIMTCQTEGGEILGVPGRIPDDGKVYLHNQRLGKVEVLRPDIVDDSFLYWLFLSKDFNNHLFKTASGTKILHTAPSRIEAYLTSIPPLLIQKKIGSLLNSLNDKIELNRQMNGTLDQIALTYYKHLFENKEISFEWGSAKLGSIAYITMGQSPKSEFYNTDTNGLPFHQGVTNFGDRFPTHSIYSSHILKTARMGDILLSVRAPVGRLNICDQDIVIGRGLSAIRHKNNKMSYLYYLLRHIFEKEDSIGSGTIFNAVSKHDIENIIITNPPEELIIKFETKVNEYDQLIQSNIQEIKTLTELLDYLLPRLLSGEIEVKAAEDQVEEALSGA